MKYCGKIGFSQIETVSRGVDAEVIKERTYYGDVIRNTRRWSDASQVNSDLTVSNQISIVADGFAQTNLGLMRYVTYLGQKWSIDSADIELPRIILTLGGIYNGGPQASETPTPPGEDIGS